MGSFTSVQDDVQKKYRHIERSEISHRKSTGHILRRPLPSREIASSLRFLAKTIKQNPLPPSVEVAATPPIGDKKYVILSASEISHDPSEKYMPYGNPPSDIKSPF